MPTRRFQPRDIPLMATVRSPLPGRPGQYGNGYALRNPGRRQGPRGLREPLRSPRGSRTGREASPRTLGGLGISSLLLGFSLLAAGAIRSPAARADDFVGGGQGGSSAARESILNSPFALPRPSFFHAALEVPALASAAPLPPGTFYIRLSSTHARSVERHRSGGQENAFDGLYHEWGALELRIGALRRLEVSARAVLAGWDEKLDRFLLFDRSGQTIVRDEDKVFLGTGASSRHDNVSKVVLGAKALLLRLEDLGLDVAAAASLKIPTSRAGDLTGAGTFDLNFTLLGTLDLGPVVLHANAGAGFPLDRNNLFVKEAGIDLNPFFHWGTGAAIPLPWGLALIAQIEGNTSAFRDVEFLDGHPLTAFGGLRKIWGSLVIEAGAGAGLIPDASYDYLWTVGVGLFF